MDTLWGKFSSMYCVSNAKGKHLLSQLSVSLEHRNPFFLVSHVNVSLPFPFFLFSPRVFPTNNLNTGLVFTKWLLYPADYKIKSLDYNNYDSHKNREVVHGAIFFCTLLIVCLLDPDILLALWFLKLVFFPFCLTDTCFFNYHMEKSFYNTFYVTFRCLNVIFSLY